MCRRSPRLTVNLSRSSYIGVARGTIRVACQKKTSTACGYHWEYLPKATFIKILSAKNTFEKVYTDLKTKIETQEYNFNSFVPSENELTKIYDCSRSTVRRALAELIQRGYMQVRQGSRVRVIYESVERNIFKIGGIESFKEAAIRNGFSYTTKVILLKKNFCRR